MADELSQTPDDARISVDLSDAKVVVDELLCYMWYHLKSSTPGNIKRVVMSQFATENIAESKKTLWRECASCLEIDYHSRRNTSMRTQSEANVSDIIDALIDIDLRRNGKLPIVLAAADLGRLPRHSPEELNDVAVLQRMDNLEKKLNIMESGLSANQVEIITLKDQLQVQESTVSTHGTLIETIFKEKSESEVKKKKQRVLVLSSSSSSDYSDSDTDDEGEGQVQQAVPSVSKVTAPSRGEDVSRTRRHSMPTNQQLREISTGLKPLTDTNTEVKTIISNEKTPVVIVEKERGNVRSFANAVKAKLPPRNIPIRGFSDRAQEQGFSQQRHQRRSEKKSNGTRKIFIFNVPQQDTEVDVRQHLTESSISVNDLCQVSHPEARRKSFVVNVKSQLAKRLLSPSFWPGQVRVREYTEKNIVS